jgi:hypothetical protein
MNQYEDIVILFSLILFHVHVDPDIDPALKPSRAKYIV